MSKRCSYEELQRKYRNMYSCCRYWRHRQCELERQWRRRRKIKPVRSDVGVEADVSEDVEIACSELNDLFE